MNTNDEGPDLEKAELLQEDASGVYIPQRFARDIKRELVTGVSDEDYKVLEAGPEHEHYWEAWADVCDNATINHPTLGKCYLWQDGDLWAVPQEVEDVKIVLGFKFKPMRDADYDGYAGADPGSYWFNDDIRCLILSPSGVIHEMGENAQTDWTPKKVL